MVDLPPLGVGPSWFDATILPTRRPLLLFVVVVIIIGDTLAPLFTLSTLLIATMALKLLQSDDDDEGDDDDEPVRQLIVRSPPSGPRPSSFRRPVAIVVEVFDVFNLTVAGCFASLTNTALILVTALSTFPAMTTARLRIVCHREREEGLSGCCQLLWVIAD